MSTGIKATRRSSETGRAARNLPELLEFHFPGLWRRPQTRCKPRDCLVAPRIRLPPVCDARQHEASIDRHAVGAVSTERCCTSGAERQGCCRFSKIGRVESIGCRCLKAAPLPFAGKIAERCFGLGVRVPGRARRLAGAVRDCLPDAHSGFGIPRQIASGERWQVALRR
jgi:hypothetical protein